jgi:hypothetical protein
MNSRLSVLVLCLNFAFSACVIANDTAAVVAAGGIQFKREPRISMEKERLFINEKKVIVDYDFLNESNQDITTEIAFPIPPFDHMGYVISDFHVWINDDEIKYAREIKATLGGQDYSAELSKLGLDIVSFGHLDLDENFEKSKNYQIAHLSPRDASHLIELGLVDKRQLDPLWRVEETYHWTQTFPARKTTHIRHEYSPVYGRNFVSVEDLDPDTRKDNVAEVLARPKGSPGSDNDETYLYMAKEVENVCVDRSLARKIRAEEAEKIEKLYKETLKPEDVGTRPVSVFWVQYILSTANSWKTPIKDFTLIVERSSAEGQQKSYVSFCWDGPVRRVDENHFEAHKTNFVPRKELNVAFLFAE